MLIVSLTTSACRLFSPSETETITVELPQWPPEQNTLTPYPPLSRWKIQILGEFINTSFYLEPQTLSFNQRIKLNEPCTILAFPITTNSCLEETSFFLPCGNIYPYNLTFSNSGKIFCPLEWESGAVTNMARIVFLYGEENLDQKAQILLCIKQFNWQKALFTTKEKIISGIQNNTFYNPWFIEFPKALENLFSKDFAKTYMNAKNCIFISCEPVFLSSFVPENEFYNQNQQLTVKTNFPNLLYFDRDRACILTCSSTKKVSAQLTYLPIFNE